MQTTNNLGLKKPGAEDVVNIEDLNSNSDVLDGKFGASSGHGHTGAAGDGPKIGSSGLAAGAATDTVIGSRTVSDATAPTGDSGTPTTLFGWLANMIKAITGGATWRTLPGMTIAAIKTILDAATNASTASTLMKRDANGRAQVSGPLAAGDIANKGYVDTAVSGATIPDASLTTKGKVQLSSATDSTSEALAATPKAVKAAYDRADQAFTQASNGKSAVAAAITGMGQAASGSDTFAQLAVKIGDISKDATVAAGEVLSGKTFYQGGAKKTGTMPHITSGSDPAQGVGQWPDGSLAVYPSAGYRKGGAGEGEIKVSPAQLQAADGDLSAANIRSDKAIFGVQGNIPIFGGGHYVTPEFTSWDGVLFFRPNGAGGSGQMLFEGDSWIRGNEPNFLSSNIRKGTSIFGKAGTMVEGPNFTSDIRYGTMGSNVIPVPNSGGMYYYLNINTLSGQLGVIKSYYNSVGVFQYSEMLVPINYTATLRLQRDTFITWQYWYTGGEIGDDGYYDRGRMRTYTYNGVLVDDTGDIQISTSGGYRPTIWAQHLTVKGILLSSTEYSRNIWAWARNGVLLMNLSLGNYAYVRGQGGGNYSEVRMGSWLQISEGKVFVDLALSNSSHTNGVAEITLGLDGLSASGTYSTWSGAYYEKEFALRFLNFAKRYFV